jgi:hypothetical protein
MKKIFILLLGLLILAGCSKGVKLEPEKVDMTKEQAILLMEDSLKDVEVEDILEFDRVLVSEKGISYAFMWKRKGMNKFFLRFWEIYGDQVSFYYEVEKNRVVLMVRSDSIANNCYGYVYKEPKVTDFGVKVIWEDYSKFGCNHNLELTFKSKTSAENFAAALFAIKSSKNRAEGAQIEKEIIPAEENRVETKTVNEDKSLSQKGEVVESSEKLQEPPTVINKCTVEKILKMQEIGLTKEEIEKVCQ